jgi:low temperature requirement protein LtrA
MAGATQIASRGSAFVGAGGVDGLVVEAQPATARLGNRRKVLAMVEQRRAGRRGRVLGGVRPTGEDHQTTTFELFFDLVYVFAATQVTGYMAHAHSGHGVVQGLLLLALLWWTWSAYAWLGNQARADEGVLRVGMAAAMAAIFVVALTIPEAWHDAPGGLDGPLVLVAAYLLVRCVHLTLYAAAAAGDRELRHQLAVSWGPMLASAALLVPGALLGGWAQTLLFAGALLVDWVGIWLTSRQGSWRLHSAGHWTERHGGFIILAIGESVVAIGVGAAQQPISAPLLFGAILGVAVAVGLWWLYFDVASLAAEHQFAEVDGQARARLALEAYTYGHFPIVAGIVLAALGVEGVLAHADETKPLGGFSAAALFGGAALYLAGELLFKQRMHSTPSLPRLVAIGVLLAALPGAVVLPPLAGLAGLVLILAALVTVETTRYAQARRSLRNG